MPRLESAGLPGPNSTNSIFRESGYLCNKDQPRRAILIRYRVINTRLDIEALIDSYMKYSRFSILVLYLTKILLIFVKYKNLKPLLFC